MSRDGMARMEQSQTSGENSTNISAGHDVVFVQESNYEQMRQVAMDIFKSNFLEFRGIAEDVARARAEKITKDYFEKLTASQSQQIQKNLSDPDLLRCLYRAQEEFACSGSEDLEQILVDLLIERAEQEEKDIEAIVLNEAINVVCKLTADQRTAIAAVFLLRYTGWDAITDLTNFYYGYLRPNFTPVSSGLPKKNSAYQHIEYVGAGSVSIGEIGFGTVFRNNFPGYFTRGFSREQIPVELVSFIDDQNVFITSMRDPTNFQLSIRRLDQSENLAKYVGNVELSPNISTLLQTGMFEPDEIERDIAEKLPELADLITAWNTSNLKHLTLTTIGLAIGHGYWRQKSNGKSPLSIWL
jgi:hypothetical protein